MDAEQKRIQDNAEMKAHWNRWGSYLSDRQWGTVREDYSPNGEAWEYFPHDVARSRAYRWGEDGLGGFCDRHCQICFALALWNGRDPILKERLFGLTNSEGNHGEDVKEYYFYLDNTPTHSYMRWLYKYPQQEYPYTLLVEENAKRDKCQPEYELMDTGIFEGDRYFDIVAEYAKASPEDICIRISATNRRLYGFAILGLGLIAKNQRMWLDLTMELSKLTIKNMAIAGYFVKTIPRCYLPKTRPTYSVCTGQLIPHLMLKMLSTN
jgi:hypothetical protein